MKRYVIDERGRAVNIPHFPYLYTDETGRGYELKLPRNLWRKKESELIVGDTFIAYGGKYPDKYASMDIYGKPLTEAKRMREHRRLERWGVPVMPPRIPAWRYPLVLVR